MLSSVLRRVSKMSRLELKLFFREPIGTFFTIAFPVILLITLGSAFGSVKINLGHYAYVDVFVPALLAMVLANLGLMSIPIILSEYRETGFIKVLEATPLGRSAMVAAQTGAHGVIALISSAVVIVAAIAIFGLHFSGDVGGVVIFMILGGVAFFAVGHVIGSIFRTARSAQAVGAATFFVMLFLSGAAIPRDEFPHWLAVIGGYVPLAQVVDPLANVWTGSSLVAQWPHAAYLVVMAALAVWVNGMYRRTD